MSTPSGILILDFGSQVTQLIARRLREMQVYSEILPFHTSLKTIQDKKPFGIILSGGPQSVFDEHSPKRSVAELIEVAPVMGICYGMQLIAQEFGGRVKKSELREYGHQIVTWDSSFMDNVTPRAWPPIQSVWMSHGDVVEEVPPGFEAIARSEAGLLAALQGPRAFAVQFHPEVTHTECGEDVLAYFVDHMAACPHDWQPRSILESSVESIREEVGPKDHVIVALSGGVDSTVAATLVTQALGRDRVHCVFVDSGLLRHDESLGVMKGYEELHLNVTRVEAGDKFLWALKGQSDPEQKRKTIGRVFIQVFDEAVQQIPHTIKWLVQGTLYPDVIESVSIHGESVTIKSHHNVGGLPEKLNFKLLEPLRTLFKDEVRKIGRALQIPEAILGRHPFPGPGLAIRILGEITEEKLRILRHADHVFISELKRQNLYNEIWQAFCVLLPVQTVGVQGDARTYDQVLALRAVTSHDGMTAHWFPFNFEFLNSVSNKITNEVRGINRVVYDVTSKPPGTIEWE